jgi:RNA polymerase sigma-32 factor
MTMPLLTREREQELARRWSETGDESALHELVTSHTRLVISLATRYRGYGLPLGDLIQEGNMGLLQAAKRFDAARDVRFSTYAAWSIRTAIQEFVMRNWSIVRTGTTSSQKALFFNLRRLAAHADATGVGTLAKDAKLAISRALRVGLGEVESMANRLAARDLSINVAVTENGDAEWQDYLVDGRPTPEDEVADRSDTAARSRMLARALEQLTERERRVIRERHLAEEKATLGQLGCALGMSKERVRQIEHHALQKLRRLLVSKTGARGEARPVGT